MLSGNEHATVPGTLHPEFAILKLIGPQQTRLIGYRTLLRRRVGYQGGRVGVNEFQSFLRTRNLLFMNECTINKTQICYETRSKKMHTMKVIFDVVLSFFKSFFQIFGVRACWI